LGQDQHWRSIALIKAKLSTGSRLLDVATGTGDIAILAHKTIPNLQVVGIDLTSAMLEQAKKKNREQHIAWLQGDGTALSFRRNTFDGVISAFMMRNVHDITQALLEQMRVVRPGGKIVCLEMTWPSWFPMSFLFKLYFYTIPPLLGRLLSGDKQAYTYLPKSVESFITAKEMTAIMESIGLYGVEYQLLMLGTIAIHSGMKPN
jgi:demethylmenaquinone methyltransferase/2-methoxy-6-polyprenyl-1,4-benzoquinol methylase